MSSPDADNGTSGSVVVGVDGSRDAEEAVVWAAREAGLQDRRLLLVHVAEALGAQERAWFAAAGIAPAELGQQRVQVGQELLERARVVALGESPGAEIDIISRSGDPREVLLGLASDAAMVVVGSRGRGPVASLLLGSVSISVSRRAACPVLVVRPHAGAVTRRGFLVGTDGSPRSLPGIERAFLEASLHRRPLTVVHCLREAMLPTPGWTELGASDPRHAEASRRVADLLAGSRTELPEVDATVRLTRGDVERCLVGLSHSHELLVVGRRSRAPMERFGSMSLTTSIVEHAAAPVLIVP